MIRRKGLLWKVVEEYVVRNFLCPCNLTFKLSLKIAPRLYEPFYKKSTPKISSRLPEGCASPGRQA